MPLSDIRITLNSTDKDRRNALLSGHIESIFSMHLPKKFDLHGQTGLIIELSDNGRPAVNQYYEALGRGFYYVDDFSLDQHLLLSPNEQDLEVFHLIKDAVLDVANRFGADCDALLASAEAVHATNFDWRFARKNGCKWHSSRRVQARLMHRFCRTGTELDIELVHKDGRVIYVENIGKKLTAYEAVWDYKAGKWHGDSFVILSKNGRVSYEKNFASVVSVT